jgi:hypothetical protein
MPRPQRGCGQRPRHHSPAVDQHVAPAACVAQEDPDLAVVHPTQRPRVLAPHSGRPDPLLGETRLVQDQHPVVGAQRRSSASTAKRSPNRSVSRSVSIRYSVMGWGRRPPQAARMRRFRAPYGVRACGLYTDSAVATSRSSRAAPA